MQQRARQHSTNTITDPVHTTHHTCCRQRSNAPSALSFEHTHVLNNASRSRGILEVFAATQPKPPAPCLLVGPRVAHTNITTPHVNRSDIRNASMVTQSRLSDVTPVSMPGDVDVRNSETKSSLSTLQYNVQQYSTPQHIPCVCQQLLVVVALTIPWHCDDAVLAAIPLQKQCQRTSMPPPHSQRRRGPLQVRPLLLQSTPRRTRQGTT